MPIQLQLETTSTCNAACQFCVYPAAQRWGQLMPMSMYQRIVDEAATIPHIYELCLTGLGEPTLDPMLEDRVLYARGRTGIPIGVFTNGVYMTPDRFTGLQTAGLSYVVFSLNAVRPEQHEAQMGLKGKFGTVCANVEFAIANRNGTKVEVRAVASPGAWTRADSQEFVRKWGQVDLGGYGQLIAEGNWAGDNRTVHMPKPSECCHRALTQIYVLADGRVTTCCFDPAGAQVFGDLKHQTIREVYKSKPYVEFRRAHFENKADQYAICGSCSRI
jgi:MoaA/NifB/PqqE/SkfB family radical SAM enzyme